MPGDQALGYTVTLNPMEAAARPARPDTRRLYDRRAPNPAHTPDLRLVVSRFTAVPFAFAAILFYSTYKLLKNWETQ
ncbi:hypothetical protein ACH492_12930 [Streptomyces sp. NPDC019443]|uniref:hypothetical protein n=1 Tax=Streptomyces sp. NPDC019443 TaxID=3365061 RepID=UPI0037B466CB